MDNMEKSFKVIQDLIDKAFLRFWSGVPEDRVSLKGSAPLYESFEDYTAKTGKRFRMTKDQKDRGLSRGDAFNEFIRNAEKGDK